MPAVMERTVTIDRSLSQRAERKLRRYGWSVDDALNRALTAVLYVKGRPDDAFVLGDSHYDILDGRVSAVMREVEVCREKDGSYTVTSPSLDPFYTNAATRSAALEEFRLEARWLLDDPVKVPFKAFGVEYVADVRPERRGGYSASVPALPGCFTEGETMKEIRKNLVDAAEGWLEVGKRT